MCVETPPRICPVPKALCVIPQILPILASQELPTTSYCNKKNIEKQYKTRSWHSDSRVFDLLVLVGWSQNHLRKALLE